MTESESGQQFNRTTFGGEQGEVGNGHTGSQPEEGNGDHEERGKGVGTVIEVKGPVVDVRFPPEDIPEIFNAVIVPLEVDARPRTLPWRCSSFSGTTWSGLSRWPPPTA